MQPCTQLPKGWLCKKTYTLLHEQACTILNLKSYFFFFGINILGPTVEMDTFLRYNKNHLNSLSFQSTLSEINN